MWKLTMVLVMGLTVKLSAFELIATKDYQVQTLEVSDQLTFESNSFSRDFKSNDYLIAKVKAKEIHRSKVAENIKVESLEAATLRAVLRIKSNSGAGDASFASKVCVPIGFGQEKCYEIEGTCKQLETALGSELYSKLKCRPKKAKK